MYKLLLAMKGFFLPLLFLVVLISCKKNNTTNNQNTEKLAIANATAMSLTILTDRVVYPDSPLVSQIDIDIQVSGKAYKIHLVASKSAEATTTFSMDNPETFIKNDTYVSVDNQFDEGVALWNLNDIMNWNIQFGNDVPEFKSFQIIHVIEYHVDVKTKENVEKFKYDLLLGQNWGRAVIRSVPACNYIATVTKLG